MQFVGQRTGGERDLFDALDRRLELERDLELGRWAARVGEPIVETRRDAMRPFTQRSEPTDDVAQRQRGELAERGDAQSQHDVGDVGLLEHGHRQRLEEGRSATGHDHVRRWRAARAAIDAANGPSAIPI